MGLYKLCTHKGRARDRCQHAWWGSFHHRGRLYRESLGRWGGEQVTSKTQAQEVYERFVRAVKEGKFECANPETAEKAAKLGPLTFREFAELYVERYVKPAGLSSSGTINGRLRPLLDHLGERTLQRITTEDIEALVASLKKPAILAKGQKVPRVRKPATINRYRSLVHHMFSWAVERQYVDSTPFRRGQSGLIHPENEDNKRHRRLSADEEARLLDLAPPFLRCLIIAALDTGTRRGEMLALTWADLDARAGWIRLRGATTKSRKTRWVPVSTTRLQAVFDYLRLDADGQTKPAGAPIFSNEVGEPIRYFQTAWEGLRRRAGVTDLRWHDLRHEYASRLVERGVPLSQVRDLLGHASIVTTERYDNQKPEALMAAAKRLDTGEIFKNLSSPGRT